MPDLKLRECPFCGGKAEEAFLKRKKLFASMRFPYNTHYVWHSYIKFRDRAITHGYNDDLTIDRINNEKGYEASNCRWVTMQEQQNNKRSNHIVYLGEVGHTISEWSEILGIGKTTIRMRLESGWSDEDALTVPVRKRTRGYRPSAKMDLEG